MTTRIVENLEILLHNNYVKEFPEYLVPLCKLENCPQYIVQQFYTPIYCMMHRVDTGEMAVIVEIVVYVSIVDDSAVFLKPVKEHL